MMVNGWDGEQKMTDMDGTICSKIVKSDKSQSIIIPTSFDDGNYCYNIEVFGWGEMRV